MNLDRISGNHRFDSLAGKDLGFYGAAAHFKGDKQMESSDTVRTAGREPDGLHAIFNRQKAAFQRDPYPNLEERRQRLRLLQNVLRENEEAIARAICADFGQRSAHETRMLEVFVSQESLRHARRHLWRWMKPEKRPTSCWFLPARSRLHKQPLGVVGIIVPWNYPLFLAVGPMASALAAGNRVMLKMSELAPAFGELFASILAGRFADDLIAVINFHIAQDSLPFGGVGDSGMGHYHGEEGFETFSKKKAVFFQTRFNGTGLLKPPYGKRFETILKIMISRACSR